MYLTIFIINNYFIKEEEYHCLSELGRIIMYDDDDDDESNED